MSVARIAWFQFEAMLWTWRSVAQGGRWLVYQSALAQ